MIRVQDKLLTMSMLKTRGLVVVSVGEEAVALLVGAVEVEVGLEPARVPDEVPGDEVHAGFTFSFYRNFSVLTGNGKPAGFS